MVSHKMEAKCLNYHIRSSVIKLLKSQFRSEPPHSNVARFGNFNFVLSSFVFALLCIGAAEKFIIAKPNTISNIRECKFHRQNRVVTRRLFEYFRFSSLT